ncbi:MAG: PucR family transcriptional regulator [Oscillospiraceae bacterium]
MDNNKMPFGFFLNVKMLHEILKDRSIPAVLLGENDSVLTGVQYYLGQGKLFNNYVYLCTAAELRKQPVRASACAADGCVFVIAGEPRDKDIPQGCGCITVPETEDIHSLSNLISEAFTRYSIVEKKLNGILNNHGGLMDICCVALEHFNNPVFVHDEYYNILACPQIVDGVTHFTYNERTQRYMQSVETLNAFKISPAYRQTLTTQGGQIWDSDFSKDLALYANIWINNEYKGRLVIPGAFSPIKPIQLFEATYFAEVIKLVMIQHYIETDGEVNPLKSFIVDAVNGFKIDNVLLESRVAAQSWDKEDRYVCGVLSFFRETVTHLSVFAMCNDIESHIPGSWACYYKNAIYLVVNLTKGDIGPDDLRMLMSYTIRESMLNMGVSNVFQNFVNFPMYIKQAQIALKYGQKKEVPSWYNEFRSCVLEYWMTEGLGEFSRDTLSSSALPILKKYDEKHGSNLYLTLKTYLYYERNSTLTAKLLKLHRSTLPYRLDRITQLTGLNLDDYNTRLYLNMSFTLLDGE